MPQILSSAPVCYVDWMNKNTGFNPRAQKASDYLSSCILNDLTSLSPTLKNDIDTLLVQAHLNYAVSTNTYSRDVDLVLFDPSVSGKLNKTRITVENKSIMTAHGKARFNRQGDLIASFNHVHNHNRKAIATATMIINTSSEYENPDGIPSKTPRRHLSTEYIRQTMELYEFMLRNNPDEPNDQPEAMAIILVDYNGVHEARLVTDSPALQDTNPYHYNNFLQYIVKHYEERFCS